MLDLGFEELAVVVVVALIVIGPKDLPLAIRTAGRWVRKAKSMAGDFQRGLDDMVREAELHEVKGQVERLSRTDVKYNIEKTIDPTGELAAAVRLDETDRRILPEKSPPSPPPAADTDSDVDKNSDKP